MTEYHIEKNIPAPEGLHPHHGRCKYPFAEMDIGDSFVAPWCAGASACRWKTGHPEFNYRSSTQGIPLNSEGYQDIRIWRIACLGDGS